MKPFTFVFKDFTEWWKYLTKSALHLVKGMARILFAVVFGLTSIVVHLWRKACGFVGKYPNIALGAFIVVVAFVWIVMFASNRATIKGLEHQRDSIAWQYQNFKESHGYE